MGAVQNTPLQTAYDISTDPELVLAASPGTLTIRQDAALAVDPLLEVENFLGTETYISVATAATTIQPRGIIDGALLPAGEQSYLLTTRGATVVLDTRFDTVASRTVIQSGGLGGVDLESSLFPDRATIRILLDQLEFLPQDRTFTAVIPGAGLFLLDSTITLNFVNATLSAFVRFAPLIQYQQNANPFGQGLLFNAGGTFQNLPAVAANMSTGLTFVAQNRYQANAQAVTIAQTLESLNQPTLAIAAGGTLTMTGSLRLFTGRGSLLAGATISGDRIVFTADDFSTFTGVLTGVNVGLDIEDLSSGVGGAIGIRSVLGNGSALRRFIDHTGTAESDFGGTINLTGAALFNYSTTDALGGGAAATLGTIGAPGPLAAAQVAWLRAEIAGVTCWIPYWQ